MKMKFKPHTIRKNTISNQSYRRRIIIKYMNVECIYTEIRRIHVAMQHSHSEKLSYKKSQVRYLADQTT